MAGSNASAITASAATPLRQVMDDRTATDCSIPALAAGVQLSGQMPSVSFLEPQWLVQRDGRFVQVSELLYRVLEHVDGRRTIDEIARGITDATEWLVEPQMLRQLLETKLVPIGLVTLDGRCGSAHDGAGSGRSPLGVGMRMKMLSPRFIHPAAALLQPLFLPAILVPMLAAVAAGHIWMYGVRGVSQAIYGVLYTPGALLAVFAIVIAAGLFHELGHAAALRYGGARVRGIGAGLYLIFPAFYTDVTDSYLLSRTARLRTDLGGVYFHSIFSLALIAFAAFTGSDIALLSAVLINVDVLRQFIPFVRLDGYWILADVSGIPDFFSQMGPFLRSVLPRRGLKGAPLPELRPAARTVFIIYTLLVVPVLAVLLVLMVIRLPWFLSMTSDALVHQARFLMSATSLVGGLLALGQMLLLTLPLLGTALILYTVLRAVLVLARGLLPASVRHFALGVLTAVMIFIVLSWHGKWSGILTRDEAGGAAIGSTAMSTPSATKVPAILQRARNTLSSTNSLDAGLEGVLGADTFTGRVSLQRPNVARLDVEGTPGLGTFQVAAKDGSTWVYFPAERQFSTFSARDDGGNITGFFIEHVRHFFRPASLGEVAAGGTVTYVGTETLDGAPTDVIDLVAAAPRGRVTRYYVSQQDGLIRRITWRKPGTASPIGWLQLLDVRRDVQIDRKRFDWALPADATPLQLPLSLRLPGVTEAGTPRRR